MATSVSDRCDFALSEGHLNRILDLCELSDMDLSDVPTTKLFTCAYFSLHWNT